GCTFAPIAAHGGGDDQGPAPDAPVAAPRACDLADSSLVLCLDFDDVRLGLDASAMHLDAQIANVQPMTRAALEQAAELGTTSRIAVPESPALDITNAIGFELFVSPSALPADRAFALDNDAQYSIALRHDGRITCSAGGISVDSAAAVQVGQWTHAACT